MICVQETWLRQEWGFVMQDYTAVRNDRKTGKGGGVASFVKNGTRFNTVKVRTELRYGQERMN